jgi:hypothetical protein
MRKILLLGLMSLRLGAVEFTITLIDEAGRPLAGARVEATLSRSNDPRYSSMRSFEGATSTTGTFRFKAEEDMCLIRLRANKAGYFEADADRRHGLGFPSTPNHTLTLPHLTEGVPLAYKEVRLFASDVKLPPKTWIGFDLAKGELVAPRGIGEVSDLLIWNEGIQTGWTMPIEDIEVMRKRSEHARQTDDEFALSYGAFSGLTRIKLNPTGSGILRSLEFWDYSGLKMPPLAPLNGYSEQLDLPYQPLATGEENAKHAGFYLRLRPRYDAAGNLLSAHYAKIQGRIETGYGWLAFRYYYNPVANDRRLVFDPQRNVLKPAPGAPGSDLGRYQTNER